MAKIYCLASAKGGSGKTVLCASFAAFLTELGKKVLMVDLDAATNGLTLLYLNEVNEHRDQFYAKEISENAILPKGLFDSRGLARGFANCDVVILPNKVHLLPATFRFRAEQHNLQELSEIPLRI